MHTTPDTHTRDRARARAARLAEPLAAARYVLALRGFHYCQTAHDRMRTAPAEIGR